MNLNTSVAVVFGAARGIGLGYARVLLENGVKVCISDILDGEGRNAEEKLQQQYQERIFFKACDICSEDMIDDVFSETINRFGSIDIVANNCGYINEIDWQKCIDINLGGHIRCFNVALKHLSKDNGGKGGIYIATSSIGAMDPVYWGPVYGATKWAINGWIRSWAHQKNYDVHGIRVNGICPTRVDTEFLKQVCEERGAMHVEDIMINTKEAANNMLSPDEVAKAILMLLEDNSVNGRFIRVSKAFGYDYVVYEDQPIQ